PQAAPTKEVVSELGRGFYRGDQPIQGLGSAYGDNKRFADVLNRLALNDNGRKVDYRLLWKGRRVQSVGSLLSELMNSGHTVVAKDMRMFANFPHLHYLDGDRLRPVVAPMNIDTGITLKGGETLKVPVSHSHVEFEVRGPEVNVNVIFYFGIEGAASFHPLATQDQAWVAGRVAGEWTD